MNLNWWDMFNPIVLWILMEGLLMAIGKFKVFCNLFLRLKFNFIYIIELFAINCGPGLHMRYGVSVSQLEPVLYRIPSGPHTSSIIRSLLILDELKRKRIRKLLYLSEVGLLLVVIVRRECY